MKRHQLLRSISAVGAARLAGHVGERTEVLEKTAEYVLLYASQPVLSV